jgi:UrcA family protein
MRMVRLMAAALAACTATVAPAAAQDSETINVRYHDLDLGDQHGVQRLNRRIASAVRLVCGEPAAHSIVEINAVQSCRRSAAQRAEGVLSTAIARSLLSDGQKLAIAQTLPPKIK